MCMRGKLNVVVDATFSLSVFPNRCVLYVRAHAQVLLEFRNIRGCDIRVRGEVAE